MRARAILGAILILVVSMCAQAQQWSSDPVIDRMKAAEATIIKFQELTAYCKVHYWEKQCDGISGNPTSTFMSYDDALKLGKQERAVNTNVEVAKPKTLGEIAREEKEKKQIQKEQNL